jgi:hypothetical protein
MEITLKLDPAQNEGDPIPVPRLLDDVENRSLADLLKSRTGEVGPFTQIGQRGRDADLESVNPGQGLEGQEENDRE